MEGCVTASGTNHVRQSAIMAAATHDCIGQFAGALLSCGLLNTAIQGQPFSEYVEICGCGLRRFGLPDGFDLN